MTRNINDDDDDDCIVWGESGTADLRKVASPSFTPSRSESEESSSGTPLDRTNNTQRTSTASLDTVANRILPSSSELKKRDEKSEQEIEMIWNRLQSENPNNATTTTTSTSDTPLRRNRRDMETTTTTAMMTNDSNNTTTDSNNVEPPQENRWGLVKSRRRRRDGRHTRPMTTLGAPRPEAPSSTSSSVATVNNNNGKRRMSADDAFADLLEHLKTPDRHEEAMPPPNKSRRNLSLSSEAWLQPAGQFDDAEREKSTTSTEGASPDPFGPFPDLDFEALDRSIVMTQSQLGQHNTEKGTMTDHTFKASNLAYSESNSSVQPKSTHQQTSAVVPPPAQHLWQNQHEVPNTTQKQASDTTSASLQKSFTVSHSFTSNSAGARMSQPLNQTMIEDDDDPFGPFPMVDLDMIDKSIAKATEEKAKKHYQSIPSATELDNNDPFGDFPDVDFDVLDQEIAAAVRDDATHNADLSRYRAVHVTVDTASFTKTIHVARWKDKMFEEFEDRVAIHREKGGRYPTAKEWTVDGLIHLRGEWYFTEVEKGDFLHIYSLLGHSSTSRLPLTLDSYSNPKDDDLVLIMHPENLLVPTTISETMKCTRRAVLKTRIGSSGTNKALLFGTLRHKLFEETLRTLDFTENAKTKRIDAIVRDASEEIAGCPGLTSNAAKTELHKVFPQVMRFLDDYTTCGRNSRPSLATLDGKNGSPPAFFRASGVEAIEEQINSPEMGIKGNIDLVLKAKTARNAIESPTEGLVCVELKTGHSQNTDQSHMAQLVFYNLMLKARHGSIEKNARDKNVRASQFSVLLYLNGESVKAGPISPSVKEVKSLISARNVVAVKQMQASGLRGVELNFDKDSEWPEVNLGAPQPPQLPPIERPGMCEKCYMARECSLYASFEEKANAQPGLIQQYTGHLSADEREYFITWDRLIDFEASATVRPIAMKWLRPSGDQEDATGRTASSLVIKSMTSSNPHAINGQENYTLITFERSLSSACQTALCSLGLGTGSHAIVSVDDTTLWKPRRRLRPRMHLARGIVHAQSETELVLRLFDSDIVRIKRAANDIKADQTTIPMFRLDRDDVATGITRLRKNMIDLLTGDKSPDALESPVNYRAPKLREAILKLKEPVFEENAQSIMFNPPISKNVPDVPGLDLMEMAMEFSEMNQDQRRAIEKVVTAKDYSLIQGLPGTGKTSTISFIVRVLVAHGKRILITSYTHSAVDNLLMKLIRTGIDEKQSDGTRSVVRIGDPSRCHEKVKQLLVATVASEKEGSQNGEPASAESLRHCMRKARVVGVTALTIPTSSLLVGEQFDVVIVDEAGQISQPAILGALMAADSFVLVGDHMQLPPLVSSQLAEKGGFGVSMLKRLADAHPNHVAQLTYQYRMTEDICQITNDIAYGGVLQCANDWVKHRRLSLQGFPENAAPGIYTKAIDPDKTVVFIDTDQQRADGSILALESSSDRKEGGSLVNKTEATVIERIVSSLISCGVEARTIGIISPFNAQVRLLDASPQVSLWKQQGLECSTIDRYQGREKSVILLSFVRSNTKGKVGRLLSDPRRLNVAVSRAECKLIMIGSLSTLNAGSKVLRPALERLKSKDGIYSVSE